MSVDFQFWACRRPLTRHWGSGDVFSRICRNYGRPSAAFGCTDGIPDGTPFYDRRNGFEWAALPLANDSVEFGYWDPPYDALYRREGIEIWRVCRRLAILHTFIWPRAWLVDAEREAMVAITMGPMKQIRCLQVFRKRQTRFDFTTNGNTVLGQGPVQDSLRNTEVQTQKERREP